MSAAAATTAAIKVALGAGRRPHVEQVLAGFDICECGDFRWQHDRPDGSCTICGYEIQGEGPPPCRRFRLFQQAGIRWDEPTVTRHGCIHPQHQ